MLHYDSVKFDYSPYPIGVVRPAFDAAVYEEMVAAFPTPAEFASRDELGVKSALSSKTTSRRYWRYVRSHDIWRRFHAYISGGSFIDDTLDMLEENSIAFDKLYRKRDWATRIRRRASDVLRRQPFRHTPKLRSRFEFSAMPATGGSIRPHTDLPSKIITLVIPMIGDEGWNADHGGGTSVVWPKDPTRSYNEVNQMIDFDDVENLRTYAFEPNQALVFVKTFNSWHAVWPMTGDDENVLRRSLTVNIEAF